MLSVILITKNEASNIRDCLESVKWAEEIIVLDSGSTDSTLAICQRYTANVFVTDWPGYGPQKQRALAKAKHEWVLSIDADERISEDLRQEILSTLENPNHDGYLIPRLTYYCGRAIYHGGWRPDFCLRLAKKAKASFSADQVHERCDVAGSIGKLTHSIIHYSYDNLQTVLQKMNTYSELGAKQLYDKNYKSNLSKALFRSVWTFVRMYLLRRGFLDGSIGLLLALSNAQYTFYKYAKLYLLNQKHLQP